VENLGKLDYNEAQKACDTLQTGGFSDWRLPTKEEFELIHPKLNLKKVGGGSIFQSSWYWTSTEVDKQNAWTHNLQTGLQASYFKDFKCFVKAVRSF
jgi:formylglycine-generating enzyme required for sulfatase activity